MEKKITSRITKGLIITFLLIATDLVLQKIYNNVVPEGSRYMTRLIIVFLGVLVSCIIYGKQVEGKLSFGEVFAHGFRTTAVIAFLMAVYTFIAVKFIYPPPDAAEMDAAVKAIMANGNALYEEAKQQAVQAAKNRWIIYVSISIFASLIPGILASAAGAAVGKKSQ